MESVVIKPARIEEAEECQKIYNHASIIGLLGGLTHLDTVKGKIKSSGVTMWNAFEGNKIVGSVMIAGRNQCHYAKFGEVGVLPEYRRRRIATALYTAILCQGIMEGRRLWEDTIVGDNPFQFATLPTIGLEHWAILKMKTASFKDIHLFGYNLDFEKFKKTLDRVPEYIKIIVKEDYYSADLWNKNQEIYLKKNEAFIKELAKCKEYMLSCGKVQVEQGEIKCPHNKNKNIQQTGISDFVQEG